jgi:adenylate cyclase
VSDSRLEHRLAVLMAADVVGYSRLMGIDEEGTFAAIRTVRRDVVDGRIDQHNGHILRTIGDGLLVEFDSALDAVCCATAIQRTMAQQGSALPADRRIRFRIAVHLGDVVFDSEIIHGDAVTVAAGMEGLAQPGGINVSRAVRDQIGEQLSLSFEDIGEHAVKDAAHPVDVYRIVLEAATTAGEIRRIGSTPPTKPVLAVLPFQNLSGEADAAFFLDSVVEDLITEFARARWFSVIARTTSFAYKGKGVDSKQVAREHGVRYVVEGSLRKAAGRVRISCQLVEAEGGQHLAAVLYRPDRGRSHPRRAAQGRFRIAPDRPTANGG